MTEVIKVSARQTMQLPLATEEEQCGLPLLATRDCIDAQLTSLADENNIDEFGLKEPCLLCRTLERFQNQLRIFSRNSVFLFRHLLSLEPEQFAARRLIETHRPANT